MENILIVAEAEGILLVSLKEKMKDMGYSFLFAKADVNAISKITEPLSGILIYTDEDMAGKQQPLHYIKDKVIEDGTPVFIAGNLAEIEDIEKIVTEDIIKQKYIRPVNVNELAEGIDTYIKDYGKKSKKKVLVVDDSGAMLRNVKGWLEDKYQVILANSGAMALKYLALNSPDLILLDYEMPVCDGKQVLEMIRSESEYADVPVIFLTSKGDRDSIINVMSLSPAGYLLKTQEPAEIVKYIDEFFMKQAMSGK